MWGFKRASVRFHTVLPGVSEPVTATRGTLAVAALRQAIPEIPSFHSDRHNYGCPPVTQWRTAASHQEPEIGGIHHGGISIRRIALCDNHTRPAGMRWRRRGGAAARGRTSRLLWWIGACGNLASAEGRSLCLEKSDRQPTTRMNAAAGMEVLHGLWYDEGEPGARGPCARQR
jgi:hypothetical protein